MKRGSCSVKTWCVASTSMAQYCINSCRGQQSPNYLSVFYDEWETFRGPCNMNIFGLWLLTIWHGICHESLTWKLFLTSTMLPFTKVSLASFFSGGPPTYRAWTSARLLMLLIFTQSQEPIYTKASCHTGLCRWHKTSNLSIKKYWHFDSECCSWNMVNKQTIGPSFFCPAFLMCSLTSWRPFFLPSLLAIHSVRWNPVSPEMAMWRLMVSMKRTFEPFLERKHTSVLYVNFYVIQRQICATEHIYLWFLWS